uniref:Uncharacterized protein n=1 Tax=Chenopodium quinoa TaxID=63459 RepID=A0A803LHZ1_CHEQI
MHGSDSEEESSQYFRIGDLLFLRHTTPNPKFTIPFLQPPIPQPYPIIYKTAVPTPLEVTLLEPPIPTFPEVIFNNMDIYLKTPSKWYKFSLHKLRHFILYPHLVSPPFQEMLMVEKEGQKMIPTLLPDLAALKAMCPVLEAFVRWWLQHAQLKSLPWVVPPSLAFVVDPAMTLPQVRNIYTLKDYSLKITAGQFTNSLVVAQTQMGFRQLEVLTNCLLDLKLDQGIMEAIFTPRNSYLHSVVEGKFVAVGTSTVQETRKELFLQNFLPEPMIGIAWNARGISRKGFLSNSLHLFAEHSPDLLFISETKTSRAHTEKIIKALPFDSYHLTEPRGFSRGILLLWNSDVQEFYFFSKDLHAIHGVFKVKASNQVSFLSTIYASPNFTSRLDTWSDLENISNYISLP